MHRFWGAGGRVEGVQREHANAFGIQKDNYTFVQCAQRGHV